jgi:LysM repeat protein
LAAPTPGLRGSAAVAGQVAAFLLARAAQPEAAAQRLTELAADRWGSCQACPSAVAYQNQAAEVYLAAQQPAKALAFYQKGLQMLAADRQDARPALAQYLRMAQLHQNQRDTAALLRLYIDLEKFCEARVYPLPAPAALGLAEHYQQRNQRTLAIAYARKALLTADLDLLPGLPAQVNTEPPPSEQATEEEGEEEATTDGPANPSPAKSSVEQPTNPVAKRAVALLRLLTQVDTARPEDFREFVIHTVGPDETLDQIMELYQVSRACLEEWNFIENNYPLPGQQLRVCRRATWDLPVNPAKPPEANASRQHRTRSGDRWETLAREYQTTVPQLLAWNPRLKPGPLPVGENLKVGEYFTPCGCGK